MSFSTRKQALDDIADVISNCTAKLKKAKQDITDRKNELVSLPTTFADEIAEIQALAEGLDAADDVQIAELAQLTSEFVALRTAASEGVTALADIEEY
jgi:hypothetical protein